MSIRLLSLSAPLLIQLLLGLRRHTSGKRNRQPGAHLETGNERVCQQFDCCIDLRAKFYMYVEERDVSHIFDDTRGEKG